MHFVLQNSAMLDFVAYTPYNFRHVIILTTLNETNFLCLTLTHDRLKALFEAMTGSAITTFSGWTWMMYEGRTDVYAGYGQGKYYDNVLRPASVSLPLFLLKTVPFAWSAKSSTLSFHEGLLRVRLLLGYASKFAQ